MLCVAALLVASTMTLNAFEAVRIGTTISAWFPPGVLVANRSSCPTYRVFCCCVVVASTAVEMLPTEKATRTFTTLPDDADPE